MPSDGYLTKYVVQRESARNQWYITAADRHANVTTHPNKVTQLQPRSGVLKTITGIVLEQSLKRKFQEAVTVLSKVG